MKTLEAHEFRDDWIRTSGLFHPKEARYQAAPRPVNERLVSLTMLVCQMMAEAFICVWI